MLSTGSFIPGGPFNAVYCTTKAYVLSFSEEMSNIRECDVIISWKMI